MLWDPALHGTTVFLCGKYSFIIQKSGHKIFPLNRLCTATLISDKSTVFIPQHLSVKGVLQCFGIDYMHSYSFETGQVVLPTRI